jgi:hypothetical protein
VTRLRSLSLPGLTAAFLGVLTLALPRSDHFGLAVGVVVGVGVMVFAELWEAGR